MLILASGSPRRAEILKKAGLEFTVRPAASEDNPDPSLPPDIYTVESALSKAKAVAGACGKGDAVLAADTIVYLHGDGDIRGIIGKPKDSADAFRILRGLSGRTHTVYTGYVIMKGGNVRTRCVRADVTFRDMTDREILDYIATGEPMDKAGAYGVQGDGIRFVERIDGDFYNVMGLPLQAVDDVKAALLNAD